MICFYWINFTNQCDFFLHFNYPKDIVDLSALDITGAQFYCEGPMDFTSSELPNSCELDYDNSVAYGVY